MQKKQTITCKAYNGKLPLILALTEMIESGFDNIFTAVIVHGSVATNEIIPYSDFDGLLIVKDKWIDSNELERFKRKSMKHIFKFDPLQHHGWFQIKESELLEYPEHYLPLVILKHSKTIYPIKADLTLSIKKSKVIDYKTGLINMLDQFEKRDKNNWKPKNMFQLKSMLSQIMLIPCLYYSAINNKGIFKRESFEAVKPFFSSKEWMPIEVASKIRSNWNYKLNFFQKTCFTTPNVLIRKFSKKLFGPKINPEISNLMNQEFYNNLQLLVRKIKKELI